MRRVSLCYTPELQTDLGLFLRRLLARPHVARLELFRCWLGIPLPRRAGRASESSRARGEPAPPTADIESLERFFFADKRRGSADFLYARYAALAKDSGIEDEFDAAEDTARVGELKVLHRYAKQMQARQDEVRAIERNFKKLKKIEESAAAESQKLRKTLAVDQHRNSRLVSSLQGFTNNSVKNLERAEGANDVVGPPTRAFSQQFGRPSAAFLSKAEQKRTQATYTIMLTACEREFADLRSAEAIFRDVKTLEKRTHHARSQLKQAQTKRVEVRVSRDGLFWDSLLKGITKEQQLVLVDRKIKGLKAEFHARQRWAAHARRVAVEEMRVLRADRLRKWSRRRGFFMKMNLF